MDGMKREDGAAKPPGQVIFNAKTGQKAGYVPADKDGDGDVDEDDRKAATVRQMALKQAEQKAKDNANSKGGLKPDVPSEVVGKGNSAMGQPKKEKIQKVHVPGKKTTDKKKQVEVQETKETKEAHEAEVELNAILKKSPGKQARQTPRPKHVAAWLSLSAFDHRRQQLATMKRRLTRSLLPACFANSRHLLQDILPPLQASQGRFTRKVHHHP